MNKNKFFFISQLLSILSILGCNATDKVPDDPEISNILNGKYLVDNIYFPQDTLVLHKFSASDSTKKEKLLVEFYNDSIFLSRYNFSPWYGKWFCNFHKGKVKLDNGTLCIEANLYTTRCTNENPWQRIDYNLLSYSDSELIFIKVSDTSNCITWIEQNLIR